MNERPADSRHTILVVDDEEHIVRSLSFLLEKEEYHVVTAANGQEAIDQYMKYKPQTVLLDVMMPVMDGYETARHIRALDKNSTAHIIFLTAKGTVADRKVGYQSGADDYVVKPFDNETILQKVAEKML